jgi:hypothetical protein
VGYTSATKVLLAFETPFWERENSRKGGATFTDLAIKQVYYPQLGHNTNSCKDLRQIRLTLFSKRNANIFPPKIGKNRSK